MGNSKKVLSIVLLALAVSLFGCSGDYSILVINTPPNPEIVQSPITLSNLSPTSIVLFHQEINGISFTFNQSGANANGPIALHLCLLGGDSLSQEVRYNGSGYFFPSPIINISTNIDASTFPEGDGGSFFIYIIDFSGAESNRLWGTWIVN